ncbi:peptidyl-prolyl cis-trans isomerase FKBP5-like [Asterias amurensis]|uniref:peptidyl-prolyl cis-trans isomerase FKBP5-like n=1 Tax=Asterias amurensis TaxID=7602 RepID=UPI003AB19131
MAVEKEMDQAPQKHPLAETGEDITPKKDGGVLKAIIKAGVGEDGPMKGDNVSVHYVGTLLNGEEFDSSRRRNEKFSFKLGEGRVIKAWDLGVATMKRGEVAVLTCGSEYAYGKNGQGKIPADATLVFEVELFDWSGEDLSEAKDGGIMHRTLEAGSEYDKPTDNSALEVHLIGKHGDRVFDDRDVSFILGEGCDHNIPEGLERGLQEMKSGELAEFKLQPKYGFGEAGNADFNIPADASLTYQVKLTSFEKAKESWEMNPTEKLSSAEVAKTKGTEKFKGCEYKKAVKQYKRITDYLDHDSEFSEEEKKTSNELLLAAHLNLAMSYIKMEEFTQAVEACDKALEIDGKNIKGLFRRGQANLSMADPVLAKKDFSQVVALDPNNKAAKNQLVICQHKIKQANEKEKKLYGKMFEKFAERDRKIEEATKPSTELPTDYGGVFNKEDVDAPSNGGDAQSNEPSNSSQETSETPNTVGAMEAEV